MNEQVVIVLLAILGLFMFLVFCIHGDIVARRKKAEQERRLRALQLADIDCMDGLAFEH